jgi:DNA-binding protein HU-beta
LIRRFFDSPLTLAFRFDMNPIHWRFLVNKRDMVGKIASGAEITRVQASKALEAFLAGIQTSLEEGNRVTISGFGTFDVFHRKARRVRNPQNGGSIEIRARRVPRFAAAPDLKSAVDR